MAGRHSEPVRGLMATKKSPLFEGRFGRMFRSLPAARFGKNDAEVLANLKALGDAMSAKFDKPFDGKDAEESGIPALYTYLGQFIDHDITFDPASSLQMQNDPDALTDFRTPAFDLDNVYGRGPDDQPYMYDGELFLLGEAIDGGGDPKAVDLPRNNAKVRRALIGDPRNDENALVSQLQGLFLRFHNRMRSENKDLAFAEVQQRVRFHYQFVVLNDFLPRVVHSSVLSQLKDDDGNWDRDSLEFYHWKNQPFMPVEFSVAAYRLGHSMIRPGYRLNDNVLLPIFPLPSQGLTEGLTGFRAMNQHWGLDWGRFIDVDARQYDDPSDAVKAKRLQFAYRLDTSLVNPLAGLPPEVAKDPASLAQRNLERAWRLGLPSGQDVARAMGEKHLDDKEILIGKATGDPADITGDILSVANGAFKGKCPLWTYILAEAMRFQEPVTIPVKENVTIQTPRLGPVGGRIVAEVFLGMMFGDPHSMLSLYPDWCPPSGPKYTLKDFVNYALGR